MTAAPDVLVIIPSYGHFDYVRNTIRSLEHCRAISKYAIDYVIIDDASDEWDSIDWQTWPSPDCRRYHFDKRAGLTRSWNAGLYLASEISARYAVCANSDIVFSPMWEEPLIAALEAGFSLVGPVTNAPGHATWQSVYPFTCHAAVSQVDDSKGSIDAIAAALRDLPLSAIEAPLNGFFMMAQTNVWWRGSFDKMTVFNPQFPLAHNEQELQQRWATLKLRVAFVPRSYIFHYRSVSRPNGLDQSLAVGAYRRLSLHPDGVMAGRSDGE